MEEEVFNLSLTVNIQFRYTEIEEEEDEWMMIHEWFIHFKIFPLLKFLEISLWGAYALAMASKVTWKWGGITETHAEVWDGLREEWLLINLQ